MIDTAVGRTAITFKTLELWADGHQRVDFASPGDLEGRYYMRFDVVDQPGVLGQITGDWANTEFPSLRFISTNRRIERQQTVPIVIMTHRAKRIRRRRLP